MAKIRTVDFLPNIFQTSSNKQFLAATLDQIVQNPEFRRVEGFIGAKIGPGVNPDDAYVVEPTPEREDYQLDPCVVSLKPDTNTLKDAITYPGILDTIELQGGVVNNADRLFDSQYYSWDPFVDFDMLSNYGQYFWLPEGPSAVTVSATDVPTTNKFYVKRENGSYSFDKVKGNDPTITLARGGTYTFVVDQSYKEVKSFDVRPNYDIPDSAFMINRQKNPELILVRGKTYYFNLNLPKAKYPFCIKTEDTLGFGALYENGVYRNGAPNGQIIFVVPQTAPNELYYVCADQENMRGKITVVDPVEGEGPGFWIQTQPGTSGVLPEANNISSRDVLGVVNNGSNTGEITFNVPLVTAQKFYFEDLTQIDSVDLISFDLTYDDIQDLAVNDFILRYPDGIDGITNLNGRTILFSESNDVNISRWTIWKVITEIKTGINSFDLVNVGTLGELEKTEIRFGEQYSRTSWYHEVDELKRIPLLTATLDTLYYQDSIDSTMYGKIKLINQDLSSTILIDEIIGAKNYISPNGVQFTNGLKVTFQGSVEPSAYIGKEFYVEGVGISIQLIPVERFVTPEQCFRNLPIPYDFWAYDIGGYDGYLHAPIDPEYVVSSRTSLDRNAWSRSNRWFHRDVILATNYYNRKTNLNVELDSFVQAKRPILQFRGGTKLFNFGTYGLDPISVIDFDTRDALLEVNGEPAYVVDGYSLKEGSTVIFAGDLNPEVRRTIFRVRFINPEPVNNGNYDILPYAMTPFSAPTVPWSAVIYLDPIYVCEPNDSTVCLEGQYPDDYHTKFLSGNYDMAPYASTPYDSPASEKQNPYNGGVKGVTFYYDGLVWVYAQQMEKIYQPILFDIFNQSGFSLADRDAYPSSTFTGSELFSYAVGTGNDDPVIGIPLKYLNIQNIGDLVFENDLYTQTFSYVKNSTAFNENVSIGFVRQYSSRVDYDLEIGWQNGITNSIDRQISQFKYDAQPVRLDVEIDILENVNSLAIFINGLFIEPSRYDLITVYGKTQINWKDVYPLNSTIEVIYYSSQVSTDGHYQIPMNLANNPLNGNSPQFSLGTIRNHYDTIAITVPGLEGKINGANNSRDLGNLVPYGLQILQQSSPLTLAGYFMRDKEYDIFGSLAFNDREYTQFKNQLLSTVANNEFGYMNPSDILDSCISRINLGKTNIDPFYWSDMLPVGADYTEQVYKINALSTGVFGTGQVYDFTSANFKGLSIYVTEFDLQENSVTRLLERGSEYLVSQVEPIVTVLVNLPIGSIVTVREYPHTQANFVPNTPTKMGLYPKYKPMIYYDTTYVKPHLMIQGHDGSLTLAFGDIRDQVLLEFEKRIYNNIKLDGNPVPMLSSDVIPGFFRTTDYSKEEIVSILEIDFLSWVGNNRLDYRSQDYIANNAFTYNYSECGTKLDSDFQVNNFEEERMPGAWRGIYRYFYDTTNPARTPWEMLGFSEQPCWWCDRYGPAPYTSGNLVLWEDLENGYVADPAGPYYLPKYARPGLTNVIPVDEEGTLIAPLYSVVGQFNEFSFKKSWTVLDGGPTEYAWWTSSSYPFAVMRLLALTQPAEFFSLFIDRDLYRYDSELNQYLYNGRYRVGPQNVEIYGNGVSKASYINWIIDYNKQLGRDSTTLLTENLRYLTVKMGYRVGGYTDHEYLTVYADHALPGSANDSQKIPVENYSITLYKNQPNKQLVYSAVTIEVVDGGYRIGGYDTIRPYFKAFISQSSGILRTITTGGITVQVPANYTDKIAVIPYATVFSNDAMVVDFILSYGLYLESIGMSFQSIENGKVMDWNQMAEEFLYFSGQNWAIGTVIALNPAGIKFTVTTPGEVADTIESVVPENMILDQYRVALPTREINIERLENNLTLESPTGRTLSFARLRFVQFEDIIIIDNNTVFNDLIYDPITGARQSRLLINGWVTTEWNGTMNAPGFILNRQETVKEWKSNKKYTKGQIVLFKNNYWSALEIIQPKEKFEYSEWIISDYSKINTGLMLNPPNMSDQLANSYDVYDANLNIDQDLLSFGLIGFRPRKYMSDLNLNDISQVGLYQQFLGSKGTPRSVEAFTYADLGKEQGSYKVKEIWAILSSTYGANANKSFVEFRLNETYLTSNPCTLQVVRPFQISDADQTFLVSDLWRTSAVVTTTDIFPTSLRDYSETALPSAGYVDIEDADITVFDINDPSSILNKIDTVGVGTIIWAAKSNNYDWNIYRCEVMSSQITQVSNNLNGTSIVQFKGIHGLKIGDLIIIRYVNTSIDGVYRVLDVTGINTIIIAYNFTNSNQSTVYCTALAFRMETTRVKQPSDIASLPYVNNLTFDSKVWVDNNGDGLWEVIEKVQPFDFKQNLREKASEQDSYFGYSVSQSYDGKMAIIGAPGANAGNGQVEFFKLAIDPNNIKDQPYEFIDDIRSNAEDTKALGCATSLGKDAWLAIGANQSYNGVGYVLTLTKESSLTGLYGDQQLLIPDSLDPINFGSSVSISFNEQWLYVGAPISNQVFAYARIDVPSEAVVYVADGSQRRFNYSLHCLIDSDYPEQLQILVDNLNLEYPYDYRLDNGDVVLTAIPNKLQEVKISRRIGKLMNQYIFKDVETIGGSGTDATFDVGVTSGEYSVAILNNGVNYKIGDTLTINGNLVGGVTPTNNITINVTKVDKFGNIISFNYAGQAIYNNQSYELRQYFYSVSSVYSFVVTLNAKIQRPFIDYTYDPLTTTITFVNVPAEGVDITVRADSYWELTNVLNGNVSSLAKFGYAISSSGQGRQLIVGAPYDDLNGLAVGSTTLYNKTMFAYNVKDSNQRIYDIPEYNNGPITVSINGTLLTNKKYSVLGQYQVIETSPTKYAVELSPWVSLGLGDNIDIDTSIITQVQKFTTGQKVTSQFGNSLDFAATNNEFFVGAPADNSSYEQSGSVYRYLNQSRTYGTTVSTNCNPVLTAGSYILVNGSVIKIKSSPKNTIEELIISINSSDIPNVTAKATSNAVFYGNGKDKTYNIGNIYSSAASYNTKVYLNNTLLVENVDYTYNNSNETLTFILVPSLKDRITVVSGRIIISANVLNANDRYHANYDGRNELTVLPGQGPSFTQIGFDTYTQVQKIVSPRQSSFANFGYSVSIDSAFVNLVVGAPNGNAYEEMSFDNDTTYFDSYSTVFSDVIFGCGVAYTYDYMNSVNASISNPGKFIFGQQVYNRNLKNLDRFGLAVNYVTESLIIGAPTSSNKNNVNTGKVYVYKNTNNLPSWQVNHIETPQVDSHTINSTFMYDRLVGSWQQYFDCINPLQGKILGAAAQNIDYIGAVDPANYNVGVIHNIGDSWGEDQLGKIWWDTDTVRFLNPYQNNINYASRRWGQIFPGSTVDIYQWVVSNVPPIAYTGAGVPLSTTTYTMRSTINEQGYYNVEYYYWVRGLSTVEYKYGKTLSSNVISQYISDPRSSGIPYTAILGPSQVAIYNALNYISAADTILHIDYDQSPNDDCIHTEYQTILTNDGDSFLTDVVYRKLIDSFAGSDVSGNNVPDPMLSPGEKYGVQFRPRQSMFIDRFSALRDYLTAANTIINQYPVSESKSMSLLFAQQAIPPAREGSVIIWNESVPNNQILEYQDIADKPDGYRYLVDSNSNYRGYWTVLEIDRTLTETFKLVMIQSYYTPNYWNYVNWYEIGYDPNTEIVAEVPYYAALQSLSEEVAPVDSTVKVTTNSRGKYELYKRTSAITWLRVGLEDGTIQFSDSLWNYLEAGFGFDNSPFDLLYYDEYPTEETRYVIRAINEQILVDELKIYRNDLLISIFEMIYAELQAPYWLFKTSLINVDHRIRNLIPYTQYQPDNQTFVQDYINEVKPYHTIVKQFNMIYYGTDTFNGSAMTDFDCPARWDSELPVPQYVSPMLLPYIHADTTVHSDVGDLQDYSEVWDEKPWKDWYDNHTLSVQVIEVIEKGYDYHEPPTVTIIGDCTEEAYAEAIINDDGEVVQINVLYTGLGYTLTPTIEITGVGDGAKAIAHLGNLLGVNPITNEEYAALNVRSITTVIRYDRCEYKSTIIDWIPGIAYSSGDLVRYIGAVWKAKSYIPVSNQFNPEEWMLVNPSEMQVLEVNVLNGGTGYPPNSEVDVFFTSINSFEENIVPAVAYGITDNTGSIAYVNVENGGSGYTYPIVVTFGGRGAGASGEAALGPLLSAADRVMGYYAPTVNQPGRELSLVIDGIDFPGVQVWGLPYVYPHTQAYDLDTIYRSNYMDLYLGKRYIDINVAGCNYISTDANHAPEELVLGSTFDTVDIRVYTRPNGHHPESEGHGFSKGQVKQQFLAVDSTIDNTISFEGLVLYVTAVIVTNQTTGRDLTIDYDYTVNWDTQEVYINNGAIEGDIIVVEVFGPGGGTQIFKEVYVNDDFTVLLIDVPYEEIIDIGWFVDGVNDNDFIYYPDGERTLVEFNNPVTEDELATIVVIAPSYLDDSTEVDYSWSTAVTQVIEAESGVDRYNLTNSMEYTNPVNIIVTVNGLRMKTAAGALYRITDAAPEYNLPQRIGIDPYLVADSAIFVYVDGIKQTQGVDYDIILDNPDQTKYVKLKDHIRFNEEVLISVVSDVECYVDNDELVFNVPVFAGDIIKVTSWNDTRQQDLVTNVFVGPVDVEVPVVQGYSVTRYSPDTFDGGPGSFDCTYYVPEVRNDIFLDRIVAEPARLWVTVNGEHKFYGNDFTVRYARYYQGYSSTLYDYAVLPDEYGSYDSSNLVTEIVFPYVLSPTDVVMITDFTDILNPDATAYRIFQDMNGIQVTHNITMDTTTVLMRTLSPTANIIYVEDASHLNEPNFEAGIWGVLTINGERIMYRDIDLVNNTVSSLLRGTGGTGAANHIAGSYVYDMSYYTTLPKFYQNYVVESTEQGDGFRTEFTADNINIVDIPEIRVVVGGVAVNDGWTVTNYSPVTVTFDVPPLLGVDVTLWVLRANSWDIPKVIPE